MSVYKPAKSPFWAYDFVIRGQRFHGSTGQRTKLGAKAFEDAERKRCATGREKVRLTLDDAFGLYWRDHASGQSSAATSKSHMKTILREIGASRLCSGVSQHDLAVFGTRRRKSVSVATVNREMRILRAIWNFCKNEANADMGEDIRWGVLMRQEAKERIRELSEEESDDMFKHAPEDIHDFLAFCLATGARLSSAVGLEWSRVDFHNRVLWLFVKGGKWHAVPMSDTVHMLLSRQPRVSKCVWSYVCTGSRGGRGVGKRYALTTGALRVRWRKTVKAAGLKDFRFHDIRHTTATRALRKSGNMRAVQRLLGHEDITTTQKYAHVQLDDVLNVME